jgi:hypothetical protein
MIYSSNDNTNDSSPYTVTINDGGVDSNNWTVSSDGPMTAGATVTLTYTGTKTVEKLTAVEATVHQLTDVDACIDNMGHEGNGTRNQGRNNAIVEGSISGTPWSYYIFYQGGNNSLTYYDNGTFKIIWSDLDMNGLFAVGYHYAQGIDYNTKSFAADFKFSKAGSGGAINWIGVCGKSLNPQMDNLLLDFYIIEDWYNKPGTNILGQKCGEYTIDGDTYVLYFNKRILNLPEDHSSFASVRRTARSCGHISISAHLEKWKELVGNVLGNVTDVKLGAVIDGGTGNIDFTYFRITDYADGEQFPVDLVKTGDNTWTFTMPADNVILNAAYFSTLTLAANGNGTVDIDRDGLDDYVDYHNSLQTQEGFNEMTVIDANGGSTWQFDNANRTHYKWNTNTPGDDWLITPALQMKAGETYTVEFQVKSGSSFSESFEVKAGTALTADNLSAGTQVIANTTIQNINYSTYSGTFTPTVDGSYYIGIHCTSVKNQFILYVQDLSVSGGLPYGVTVYEENGQTVDGKYRIAPGTEVTVTATPSKGHYLSAWSGIADGDTDTDLKRTFTVGDDDMTVTATFTPYPVLTLAANGDGTVGLDGLDGYVDYHNSLLTQEGFNEMTVIDANGGSTWQFDDNSRTHYKWDPNTPGDDWLITPALQMKAGETYTVEFQVKSGSSYAESFEVKAGTALTVDNLSAGTQVIESTTHQSGLLTTYSGTFTPTVDGSYYIGIHCTSVKNQFRLYVQDLSVSSGTQPAGVTAYEENGQTVDGKYYIVPGTEVTVTATPSEGHYLSAWSGIADGDTNTDLKRTFTVGDDDMTVTATFNPCPVLTLAANGDGTVGIDGYVDYHNSLQTQEGFNEMTVIDANGGSTWQFSYATTLYNCNEHDPGDDWLITPALQMKAGETYTVEFQARCGSSAYPASFEVKAGTALTADNLSAGTLVIANTEVKSVFFTTYSGTFIPTADGSYYIGIHCTNVSNVSLQHVQNLSVSPVMLPDGVTAYEENGKTVDGKYRVVPGTEVTVTATPGEGQYLSAWSGIADGDTNTDLKRTFTVGDDMTVTATFTPCPVLTLAANGDGTVGLDPDGGGLPDGVTAYEENGQTVDGKYRVAPGTEVTVVATANENSHVTGWTDADDAGYTTGVTYSDYAITSPSDMFPAKSRLTLTMGTADATAQAGFGQNGYLVTVPAWEYVTYYADKPVTLGDAETGAALYTVSTVSGATATLSTVSTAPGETPLLIYNGSPTEKTVLLQITTAPASLVYYDGFHGTLEPKELPASSETTNYYVLDGHQFVWVRDAGTIAANRCWLEVEATTSNARRLTIVFDEATAIQNAQLTIDNYNWYDLSGRKFNAAPTKPGIYVKGGKKVVIK